jgi:hypothetical protein
MAFVVPELVGEHFTGRTSAIALHQGAVHAFFVLATTDNFQFAIPVAKAWARIDLPFTTLFALC